MSGEIAPEGPVHVFTSNHNSAVSVASVPQSPIVRFLDQQGSPPDLQQPLARARTALSRRSAAPVCMHAPPAAARAAAAPAPAQGAALAGVLRGPLVDAIFQQIAVEFELLAKQCCCNRHACRVS